jgi:glycosyltransferase involved in cell wall biosynthesis
MQYSPLRRVYRRKAIVRTAANADRIITPTKFSAQEIQHHFPGLATRLEFVHHGSPEAEPREKGMLGESCFLTVGKQLRHKNYMILCRSYIAADKIARIKATLVFLGGPGNATEEMKEYVQGQGYEGRIIFPGYVTDAERKDNHQRALALLHPSFYEGFGLPILEAMAQGVPVVSSNGSCLPEVAGDAAMLVDPGSERDWAKAMGDIDAGRIDLECMARAGYANLKRFSWDESALKLAKVMESLVGNCESRSNVHA